jgi:hypothetical protein
MPVTRRSFLTTAASAGSLAHLAGWDALSRASAADTAIDPAQVRYSPEIDELIRLIRATPVDRCLDVFLGRLKSGLSYQSFLSTLFLAAIEEGDPHSVAQIYAAHRVGCDARVEERLLPLCWALDRVKSALDGRGARPSNDLPGALPPASAAVAAFNEAFERGDPDLAERATLALARSQGTRQTMARMWLRGARRVSGTLGHHPIIVANAWRTLDALGWQHAEPALRYTARYFPMDEADASYEPNRERVRRTAPRLPAGWAADTGNRPATLGLYELLRQGRGDDACDSTCEQLATGRIQAGAAWDAVHLAAADLLVRYELGGGPIGGSLIHDVTSTNALRFGFDVCGEDPVRLLMLLQAMSSLSEAFVVPAQREGRLRNLNLLELPPPGDPPQLGDVFDLLPFKASFNEQKSPDERTASDRACRMALALAAQEPAARAFQQTARSLLCRKATTNPHDFKYLAAAFEDAGRASPQWRPYLLASSVHALHGSQSADTPALVAVRERLG